MTSHAERRRVPYTPKQMYDLVADVGSYPEFLPWISGARVRKPTTLDDGAGRFEADLVVSFAVFRESYTSLVTTYPPEDGALGRIDVEAISGPFNKLVTRYAFHPAGDNECEMSFEVDFAFKGRLMQAAAGKAFDLAMRKISAAFEERARALYGNPASV